MQRIVIIGTGFAGMWAALAAKRLIDLNKASDIKVVVVSPEAKLVVRPRLYESGAKNMSAQLDTLFNEVDIQFVQGNVTSISPDEQKVQVLKADGEQEDLPYTRLILAAGSRLRKPSIPGLDKHAFSIDTLDDAVKLENHLAILAQQISSPARNTVVVAGGGFTGIEIAAELPVRLRPLLGTEDIRVIVVERNNEIGPELGANPRPAILAALAAQGVELNLGAAVSSVDEEGVTLSNGEHIESSTVIWTAGPEATPLTKDVPDPKDPLGRIHVDRTLRAPSAKEIFVTGDAAFADTDGSGHYALMSCQHAMIMGRFAGHNAAADLLGLELKPYEQKYYGTCLDLGPSGAVVTEGWDREVRFTGMQAKEVKRYINGTLIYPPAGGMEEVFRAADPEVGGVTLA
ncbi:NAD(P)/FAD-dependent oxidoreductase [Aspergillus mulundensis]|uniref:Pyridine nucleotide-disulfide oxidoreductase family protein n=1 Tax=Aspergillus mulundensis TaxID=1810919 RepID=A0A3D8SCQ0_9EURO|nr:Pyridine nucleotide-disulfide oxidoreductase family protein [Aspergillus mulundensis]RDW84120.1 Pyridine nucleotide-disulfide oxidoreductase family protein [Aspergillus mulundensis]